LKIAVLFRGPIRPNSQSVVERYGEFMSHFRNLDGEVTTYLATWRKWKNTKASEVMSLDLFDNVIMQEEPTIEHIKRCTKLKKLPNGADIKPVYNMYYQSKTALDLIVQADTYNFIVHTRTDMKMVMCDDLNHWFDQNYYVAPHIIGNPWQCDQFGIATGEMMHKAWNYGDISNLGRMLELADKPENVLEQMIIANNIPVKASPYKLWELDSKRNQ
jgi:hypothetical protein